MDYLAIIKILEELGYEFWGGDLRDPEFKEFLTPEEFEKVQLRRENRKQALVNEALHDPQRADFAVAIAGQTSEKNGKRIGTITDAMMSGAARRL